MTKMYRRKVIFLDEGWEIIQGGISKMKRILEGLPEKSFTSDEHISLYTYLV